MAIPSYNPSPRRRKPGYDRLPNSPGRGQHSHGANRNGGNSHHNGGGNRNNGDGGGHGGSGMARALKSLLNPNEVHSGKDLMNVARSLTRLDLKPQQKAYQRLIKEIRGQSTADTLGLQNLGKDASGKVAGAYLGADKGAAQAQLNSAALGGMLNNQVAGINQQATADQQATQTGELGGHMEAMALRGAPGGGQAQQQLQALVEQQAGRTAAESQAGGNFAAALGANYTGLSGGMRQAGQLQGAERQGDIAQSIASRIAEQKLGAGQDIREALGKLAETRALKGDTLTKYLTEAIERERDFSLGKKAVQTDRMGIHSDERIAEQNRQAENQRNRQDNRTSAANNRRTNRTSRHNSQRSNQNDSQDSSHDRRKMVKDVRSSARSLVQDSVRRIGKDATLQTILDTRSEFARQIKQDSGGDMRVVQKIVDQIIKRLGG